MESKSALEVVRDQLGTATGARKCHPCGCFHATVRALASSDLAADLAPALERAERTFRSEQYDCLGCPVCHPAIAANAVAEAFPEQGDALAPCPTDAPGERRGWPPLPGDYHVARYRAPVAVCTLNSDDLARDVAGTDPEGLALVGTMRTENLGIERVIRNVLANPHIRFLILCGEDTQQDIGHLPGQSLASLFEGGIDERGRIRGARGRRPVLKNVTREQIGAFVRQVEIVDRIGVDDPRDIADYTTSCLARDPGAFESDLAPSETPIVRAEEPARLVPDPAGFFVVYPDAARGALVVEHYDAGGVLDCIVEGRTPAAVSATAIERGLLTRLDHAAYLGRELALAERSMKTGERYVQDRAPGRLEVGEPRRAEGCGCSPTAPRGGCR